MKDHKFAVGDPVTITAKQHAYTGKTGVITALGYRIEVAVGENYATLEGWELKLAPKEGDRVRVTRILGVYGGLEGTVTEVSRNGVRVEFDENLMGTFHSVDLEVFDPAPAKRAIGKAIDAKDVKIGDKVTVTHTDNMSKDVERVTVLTATVGKIVERGFNGGILTFQTTSGTEFYSDSTTARDIVLLESIEEDPMYRDLASMGPGSIIVFANKPGEAETDMAIKQPWEDSWHLVDGSKDRKPRTVGLVNIIKKKGVTYSVLRRFEQKED